MKRIAFSLGLMGLTALAFALEPNEWRFSQTFDVPAAGLVRLGLPPATLDAARPDLEDIRIVDTGEGRELVIRNIMAEGGPHSGGVLFLGRASAEESQ